jgi:hypothetical protein
MQGGPINNISMGTSAANPLIAEPCSVLQPQRADRRLKNSEGVDARHLSAAYQRHQRRRGGCPRRRTIDFSS